MQRVALRVGNSHLLGNDLNDTIYAHGTDIRKKELARIGHASDMHPPNLDWG